MDVTKQEVACAQPCAIIDKIVHHFQENELLNGMEDEGDEHVFLSDDDDDEEEEEGDDDVFEEDDDDDVEGGDSHPLLGSQKRGE